MLKNAACCCRCKREIKCACICPSVGKSPSEKPTYGKMTNEKLGASELWFPDVLREGEIEIDR